MQAACILASRHPSKHIMGQAPQYADDQSIACGQHTHLGHHLGTVDSGKCHNRSACKWPRALCRSGPTLAAGWGVLSFLAASFSAALGLSSLAASFFSGFFSSACMPASTMSEPSSQQQGAPVRRDTEATVRDAKAGSPLQRDHRQQEISGKSRPSAAWAV